MKVMSGCVNKAILVGYLGRDPEVRAMQNGGKIVTLSIATSETWTDKRSGERREKIEWHRAVIFNEKLAEVAELYMTKGMHLYVEGQIQTRKWTDQAGIEKYSTEIVLAAFNGTLTMLDSKRDAQERSEPRPAPAAKARKPAMAGAGGDDGWAAPPAGGALDDDIPF